MKESTPEQPSDKTERAGKQAWAKEIAAKAMFAYAEKEEDGPYKKIVMFVQKFRAEHPQSDFLLIHSLIGSTVRPEAETSLPLDTEDGEIERFIKTELL